MKTLKLGRRTPKRADALQFRDFWSGVIPVHPSSVDYLAALHNWQMLGNDAYGDCVAVTAANLRRLVTASLATEQYPTLQDVYAFYKTQNPNFPYQDDGMDIQTALEYWHKNAWGGCQLIAFAAVDYTNLDELKAAIAIFGGVWLGINVQSANMTEFDAGRAWNYVRNSQIEGGHSVVSGGYLGKSSGDMTFVTWATETDFTDSFAAHLFEEAWLAIQPENLNTKQFQNGIDLAALQASYKNLTGNDLPLPAPPPVPTPAGAWTITAQSATQIVLSKS